MNKTNTFVFIGIVCMMSFLSCKKSDNSAAPISNQFVAGGKSLALDYWFLNQKAGMIYSYDSATSSRPLFVVSFWSSIKRVDAAYKVVGNHIQPTAPDEIVFSYYGPQHKTYRVYGSNNYRAQIIFIGSKLRFILPKVWAKTADGTDSLQVSCIVTEP